MKWQDVADMVGKVAPVAGGAMYGPAGAAVGTVIADVLGSKADPTSVYEALEGMPQAEQAKRLEFVELALSDRQDARAMQIAALQQDDILSKRFIYLFASAWSIFAMIFIAGIVFVGVPEQSVRFADTVLGFLLGTLVSGILQFFFGSSNTDHERNRRQNADASILGYQGAGKYLGSPPKGK